MSALSVLPDVKQVRDTIISGGSPSWAVFSYAAGTSTIKLHESGDDLLDFQEAFEDSQVHYGFLRVQQGDLQKFVLVLWCGEAVPVTKRRWLQAHSHEIKNLFHGFHVEIDARNENDVDPTAILKKVRMSAGSKYTSHPSNQKPAYQDNGPQESVASVYEPVRLNPGKMSGGPKMMAGATVGTAQDIREERQRREKEQMESERRRISDSGNDDSPSRVGSSWKPVQTAPKPLTARSTFGKAAPPTAPKPNFSTGSKPAFGNRPPVTAKPTGFSSSSGSAVQAMYGTARQELSMPPAADDEDPDASVGSNYQPVRTNPRPLGSSQQGSYDPPEELSGADAVRKAREAYDRELVEREKKKAYAQDRPDDMEGLSGADRIRKEREAYDAELKRREEERIQQSGQSIEADEVIGSAQDVRKEREDYDRQLREREEERIRRWESNEGGTASRDPSLPAVPGSQTGAFAKSSAPSSNAGSRQSSTMISPNPSDSRRKSSTTGFGGQANWTMPSNAFSKTPEPAASQPPQMAPRPSTVEQTLVQQMNKVNIEEEAPPPLPPHPQERDEPQNYASEQPPSQNGTSNEQTITVVALYDYEKTEDNEISFREGEKLINVQKLDSDWWFGSNIHGTEEGLFPANFVEEVSTVVSLAQAQANLDQEDSAPATGEVVCQALFDFPGTDDQEIPLKAGDRVVEVEQTSEEWWWGRVDGTSASGYFPANHVEVI